MNIKNIIKIIRENLQSKFSLKAKSYKLKANQGFSLIELMVTIGILILVSGIVFFNHSQFSNSVIIENLAYEISLTIRQAQSYGLQVKQTNASFTEGYGVYFDISSDEFLIFADIYPLNNPNSLYDTGLDQIIDSLRLTDGNEVSGLCVGVDCSIDNLSIAFLRPNPNAIIKANLGSTEYDTAEIHVISPKGIEKKIFVNRVGQIAVLSI
ncbi:prepilin-type N-terminal cleavage/methylation domain-containing protein [Patescibacteria group bacterium]|nr:prepilin-type N-terminal cleavage/methylation domain-containing protein [Patescibacteria group bacterium]